jgi:hypothetical protein
MKKRFFSLPALLLRLPLDLTTMQSGITNQQLHSVNLGENNIEMAWVNRGALSGPGK